MKVSISVPDSVFDAAERLAAQLKVPRSQLYAQALAAYLSLRSGCAITAKLNAVYGVESSRAEIDLPSAQLRSRVHEVW
jgi:hypothetical protein